MRRGGQSGAVCARAGARYKTDVIRKVLLILALLAIASPACAARFASLRREQVYMREGPTLRHRVLWIYRRKDYPVEVLETYADWRRVRDVDGAIGWINARMLSDARSVLVTGKVHQAIRDAPRISAAPIAWAAPGVVARLKACQPVMCEVSTSGVDGWIDRRYIWGVGAGEIIP
jgi:SH3-like domain-containing protein